MGFRSLTLAADEAHITFSLAGPSSSGATSSCGSGTWTLCAARSAKTRSASSRLLMIRAWCRRFSATWARRMTRLPEDIHRALRDPTPTNRVTTWTRPRTTRTCSRTENCSLPGRFGAGLLLGTGLFVPGDYRRTAPPLAHCLAGRQMPASRPWALRPN
jgi:hypothetical protein